MVSSHLGGDQLADAALTLGELERQPRVEGREQSVSNRTPGGGRQAGGGHPALGQHDLQDEGLVPSEPLAGAVSLGECLRPMDSFERLSVPDERQLVANPSRNGIFRQIERVQHEPHAATNLDGVGIFDGWVDRQDLAREIGPTGNVIVVDDVDFGIDELQLAVEQLDLAGEEARQPRPETGSAARPSD